MKWSVVALIVVGCSSSSGTPNAGGAGTGGMISGAAGTGGTAGTGGSTGGGAAGTGDPNIPTVTMSLWEYAIGPTTQLAPNMKITNLGPRNLPMTDMEIRYWYTSDIGGASGVTQSTVCQGTYGIVCEDFNMSVVPVSPARPMADTYLSLNFSPAPADIGPGGWGYILIYITRSDGGTYDQSNDYSYNASGSALMDTTRITVYYKGALIYGTEP
jgi:hypothetical protein